jgi:hypothetical protein
LMWKKWKGMKMIGGKEEWREKQRQITFLL